VIEESCSESCVAAPQGATCAPACASDSDCSAVADNGRCVAGACAWDPIEHCKAEPGDLSCLLCCIGQAGIDLPACVPTCFPPPALPNMTIHFPGMAGVAPIEIAPSDL
jgi:hypothetical protein